jgi:PAT family beta-lactamase induction signal transducer AmpG
LLRKYHKNLAIIFLLGISAGIPLALILSTLKVTLVELGFDIKTIGTFALISIPYSLKIFFAPVIDSISIVFLTKKIGQRKSWIILTQFFLILFTSLLGFSLIFENIALIAIFALLIAFASAAQDIVIDGYRIEILEKEDQAIAASLYIYGYRIGMLISGALALILAEIFSWSAVYFIISIFILSALLLTLFAEESRKNWDKIRPKNQNFKDWFKNSVINPFIDFTKHKNWLSILIFIILFKLCDAFAGNLTLPFLLEIGFSKAQIAGIVKTFGLFATFLGIFIGGILVKKIGLNKSLWIAAIAQMVSNFSFSYLAQIGANQEFLYFTIFVENLSGGIGDSVFVAYLSSLCSITFSATQYALLSSLATFSRSTLSSFGGFFVASFGWFYFFIFSAILAIPGLIFLFFLTIKNYKNKS